MKKKFSFTLVEILTVVAIIGILAGMTLGITSYVGERNREVQTQTTIKMLEMALEQYKTKYGSYPKFFQPGNNLNTPIFRLPWEHDPSDPPDELTALFNDVSFDISDGKNYITSIKGINIHIDIDNEEVWLLDGWGYPIVYVYPGIFNRTKYDLGSAGPDHALGEEKSCTFTRKTVNKKTVIISPNFGSRTGGNYKTHFGKVDDITNFKRTDN